MQCCEWLTDCYQQHLSHQIGKHLGCCERLTDYMPNTGSGHGAWCVIVVNGLQINTIINTQKMRIAWYTHHWCIHGRDTLWIAYRLRPLTPSALKFTSTRRLWIAYRLRPLTPAPWQWHRGCRLWMARRLLPDTPTSRSCSFHSLLWMTHRLYALTPFWRIGRQPGGCEWLTDYYQQHHLYHWKHPPEVVNGLQIAITYTVLGIVDEADVVVNGSQIATINTAYCKW